MHSDKSMLFRFSRTNSIKFYNYDCQENYVACFRNPQHDKHLTRNSAPVTIPPTDTHNCFIIGCVRNVKNALAKEIWIKNFSNCYLKLLSFQKYLDYIFNIIIDFWATWT